jgi:MbtH protein
VGRFDEPEHPHLVVVNHEGMYSIWPEELPVPAGWEICATGTREECIATIETMWTDMRPRSLREARETEPGAGLD